MTNLVKIYEDMVASLEDQRDATSSQGIREGIEGIEGLIAGARQNLEAAKADC